MLKTELNEPQLAMAAGGSKTPPTEATVISWKPEEYKWLLYCKQYVINNPDDHINRMVYKNLLKWYREH